MNTARFTRYGKVTQAERFQYYRDRIAALTPPETDYDLSNIRIFEELIKYVEQTTGREQVVQHRSVKDVDRQKLDV